MNGIGKLALGTMGMNFKNRESSIQTIQTALENGIHIFNTGDFYQRGESQVVLGEALKEIPRESCFISLKFGVTFGITGAKLDVRPENIRPQLTAALDKMGMEYVDLYQPARQDIAIPVEEVMTELVKLKEEGLIKNIGLSEVDADTLRRAHKIHPIHSIEVEYSLLNREIEKELIPTAKELGVQVVVYGAVGHGILTDKVIHGGISNPMMARGILSPRNKKHNLQILNAFSETAKEQGMTMSELALGWTQAKYDHILSLIGTTKPEHLLSSLKAMRIPLDQNTVAKAESILSGEKIKGHTMRKWVFENGVGKMV